MSRRITTSKSKSLVYDIILIAGQSNPDGRISVNNVLTPSYISSGILQDLGFNNIDSFNNVVITDFDFSVNGANGSGRSWIDNDVFAGWSFTHVATSLIQGTSKSKRNLIICQCTQGYTQLSPLPVQVGNLGSWSTDFVDVVGVKMLEQLENKFAGLVMNLDSNNIKYSVKALLWHQGENDFVVSTNTNLTVGQRQSAIDDYQVNFENLISYVRGFTGVADLPIIYGTVSDLSDWYSLPIRNAQLAVATSDANAYCRDNNDLTLSDPYHFDASSCLTFGQWMKDTYESIY